MSATIIPCLLYRDARAAIGWLCEAFGFETHLVVPGDDGKILHAELKHGTGMIMLGSPSDTEFGRLLSQPGETVTQSCYVIVADVDAHFAKAKAAGADIVKPLQDQSYGGRDYACRDPEGHVWTFGTYNPWTA